MADGSEEKFVLWGIGELGSWGVRDFCSVFFFDGFWGFGIGRDICPFWGGEGGVFAPLLFL